MSFILIDHSIDNYDEVFDTSKIIFLRCNSVYNQGIKGCRWAKEEEEKNPDGYSPYFDYKVTITFENGIEKEVSLNSIGYQNLLTKLKVS